MAEDQAGRIPREVLDAAVRRLCRQMAATIAQCMAETDYSFAMIAERVGASEADMRLRFTRLLDGNSIDADRVTDFFAAMNSRLIVTLEPIVEAKP